jgi:hypothetical protein
MSLDLLKEQRLHGEDDFRRVCEESLRDLPTNIQRKTKVGLRKTRASKRMRF